MFPLLVGANMLKKALSCPLQPREPYEDCVIVKAYQLPAIGAVEQMLQIIVEAILFVVQAEAPTVIYNVSRVPRPVGHRLHELFAF
jgi:hypothetical protein